MTKKFSKILIANRGEIALRIIRAANELSIKTVAVYARGEEENLHVSKADEAVCLGEGNLNETYLNIEKILFIAKGKGVDAIHPGYGFLSENAAFAEACTKNKIIFIGPSAKVLEQMGNKITAKKIAEAAGVPVLSSYNVNASSIANLVIEKFPVLIKASYGGGGKGMQIVNNETELKHKVEQASRSALNYFGNGDIYIENYIEDARHVEVQILGDSFGEIVHLYERDCSIQRNHQKIIEEAPATSIEPQLRETLLRSAIKISKSVVYENAGTVEFLVNSNNEFFFLEMNPRIQVEHPVTEGITGIDIVKAQLSIATGNPLSFHQSDVVVTGHAIEARIYQENPQTNFTPSTDTIDFFQFPHENNLRIESDLNYPLNTVNQFDPLLAKFIVHAPTREQAMMGLSCSLIGFYVDGPTTNSNYLNSIINHPAFFKNKISTQFCATEHSILLEHCRVSKKQLDLYSFLASAVIFSQSNDQNKRKSIWNSLGYWRIDMQMEFEFENEIYRVNWNKNNSIYNFTIDGNKFEVELVSKTENLILLKTSKSIEYIYLISNTKGEFRIGVNGFIYSIRNLDSLSHYPENELTNKSEIENNTNVITSHLHGKIISVKVKKNQTVNKGEVLLIIESMKSENTIVAPRNATIEKITIEEGNQV
ncbi:MAG: ATP-grasp domain-containing protein, partial [Prolixibacteraceae bacterium]|nr:ATP-grasp domain-containing protein [Prolixibacteraceae bacterium]